MDRLLRQFDLVRIISLRERSDRRRETLAEFAAAGVDTARYPIEFYLADRPSSQGTFPTLGARGSFCSHRETVRQAIDAGAHSVLVFEDDVFLRRIEPRAIDALVAAMSSTPWDIIYFGYLQPERFPVAGPLTPWEGPTIGGHFYGLRGQYMRDMVTFMDACERRPPGHPDGGPMFRDGAYNFYAAHHPELRRFLSWPNLAGQRSSRTDLHSNAIFDRSRLLRPLAGALRAVRNHLRSRAAGKDI